MENVVRKLSFLLCFVLVLTAVNPVFASKQELLTYTYKNGTDSTNAIYTNDGNLLIEDLNIGFNESTYEQVYQYDIVKVNKSGVQKQKALTNGVNTFAKYSDEAYTLFYNYELEQLEIYNEELELVDQEKLNLPKGTRDISINQVNQYVSFNAFSYNEVIPKQYTNVYDLATKQLANDVVLPAVEARRYIAVNSGGMTIVLLDELERITKKFNYNSDTFDGSHVPESFFVYGDYISILTDAYMGGAQPFIITIAISTGEIVDKQYIPNVNVEEDTNYTTVQANNKAIILGYNYETAKTTRFEFDIPTQTLSVSQPTEQGISYITPLPGEKYYENTDAGIHIYDTNEKLLHTYTDADSLYEIDDKVGLFVNNDDGTYSIRELTTGKVLDTYSDYPGIKSIGENHYYQTTISYDENWQQEQKGTLLSYEMTSNNETSSTVYPKPVTITFNKAVDASSVSENTVFVKDSKGNKVDIIVTVEGAKVLVAPPIKGYIPGETYTLYVENVKSTTGQTVKENKSKQLKY